MPYLEHALERAVLTAPGRAVREVVDKHRRCTWSTSLEDLEELASWTTDPSSGSPPKILSRWVRDVDSQGWVEAQEKFPNDPNALNESNVLNVRLKVDSRGLGRVEPTETYTLGTIKVALSDLASHDLIWSFKMHRRTYYASHKARQRIENQVNALPDRDKKRLGFQALDNREVS